MYIAILINCEEHGVDAIADTFGPFTSEEEADGYMNVFLERECQDYNMTYFTSKLSAPV